MLRRSCFALAFIGIFGLAGIPDAKSEPTWDGVYFGIGAGAGSFDSGMWGRATKSRLHDWRRCQGEDVDGECIDPGQWKPDDDYYSYEYSKDIHVGDDEWNIFGTVQVGIDHQIGQRFVIGAFADYDLYSDSGSNFNVPWTNYMVTDYGVGSLSGNVELSSVWSVGGRIGILVTPRFLLYGLGGYTQANVDANLAFNIYDNNGTETLSVNLPDELHGYFVGAGGEIKLRNNLSFKVEYRYSDFDNETARVSNIDQESEVACGCYEERTTWVRSVNAELDAELHSVRAVLVYRLGGSDEELPPLK